MKPVHRILVVASCLVLTGAAPLFSSGSPSSLPPSPLSFPADFDRADLGRLLRSEHPRLFATENRWQEIRASIETTPQLANALAALEMAAIEINDAPPSERVVTGKRLLSVSREVLRRTLVLGVLYRLTDEEQYFERARAELLQVASFEDWHPSHFLDTAEMTLAVAVGYDWLYQKLSDDDRAILRAAILEKGLRPGMGSHSWKEWDNNWNQVCFAGLVAGALAIGDYEPDLAVAFLRETFARIHLPLDASRPHGAYPEGPAYWSYGTHFQVILISVLESALGQTWSLENYPAFQESATYINLMIGPSGQFFNYADGSASVSAMPALHWFAAQSKDSALDARERDRLRNNDARALSQATRHRLFALSLLWLDPALERLPPEPLPLHWHADGPNPIAVHRSSWAPDALFLGIKGGFPAVNHGHMDLGSFVLDWRGLRWATDLGAQSYHSLESRGMRIWDRAQASDRWRVFRLNNYSHNTLVADDQLQRIDGFAPIRAFSGDAAAPFTIIDMTAAYQETLTSAIRAASLYDQETVLLHDRVEGLDEGMKLRWGMVTTAQIAIDGDQAVLHQEGQALHVRILSPRTTFEVIPTNPPPHEFDVANPGTRMLAFFVNGRKQPEHLRVVFSPEALSDERIGYILSRPPLTNTVVP